MKKFIAILLAAAVLTGMVALIFLLLWAPYRYFTKDVDCALWQKCELVTQGVVENLDVSSELCYNSQGKPYIENAYVVKINSQDYVFKSVMYFATNDYVGQGDSVWIYRMYGDKLVLSSEALNSKRAFVSSYIDLVNYKLLMKAKAQGHKGALFITTIVFAVIGLLIFFIAYLGINIVWDIIAIAFRPSLSFKKGSLLR